MNEAQRRGIEERALREKARAEQIKQRDWSKVNSFPVWILQPSGIFPNLASQAAVQDMNQDRSSYLPSQNPAHQSFEKTAQAEHVNRPEIEVDEVDPALQVEQLANELKAVVQQADRKGQKVVAVTLRVEFAA
ncbi:hypothetical protein BH925_05020 [Rodentibacter pneumotropicus]|uniref:hypothetical protein n=1 Tax=Rodentibacter pneumotropicus TaxID=758 RepID=UPI0009C82ECB|nr:hypothetical protein [Rodentibacter pneumotropicus]OOF65192.1 hypothetical protein BH925_05020 [Rodentibacter pneumotropicus]